MQTELFSNNNEVGVRGGTRVAEVGVRGGTASGSSNRRQHSRGPLGSWSSTEATTAATITPAAVPHTVLTIADLIVALSAA